MTIVEPKLSKRFKMDLFDKMIMVLTIRSFAEW